MPKRTSSNTLGCARFLPSSFMISGVWHQTTNSSGKASKRRMLVSPVWGPSGAWPSTVRGPFRQCGGSTESIEALLSSKSFHLAFFLIFPRHGQCPELQAPAGHHSKYHNSKQNTPKQHITQQNETKQNKNKNNKINKRLIKKDG